MLEIPEKLEPLVSDYKMNLLELRKSGLLQFHNSDVDTVFDVSRSIYERNFEKINTIYKEKAIPSELGIVIGAITESQKLIDHALRSEERGGQIYMCGALEELVNEGRMEEKMALAKMMIEDEEPVGKIVKYTGYTIDKLKEIAAGMGRKLVG